MNYIKIIIFHYFMVCLIDNDYIYKYIHFYNIIFFLLSDLIMPKKSVCIFICLYSILPFF